MRILRILFLLTVSGLFAYFLKAQEPEYLREAENLFRNEKFKEAEDILMQRRKGLTNEALLLLSKIYQSTNRKYEAIVILNQLIERTEDTYDLHFMRAFLFVEVAAYPQAIQDFEYLLARPAASTSHLFYENDPDGLQPTRLFTTHDQQGRLLISKGYCLLKSSIFEKAIEDFKKAELIHKQPNLYIYWAEAFLKLDNTDSALAVLKDGLEHFPNSEAIWAKYLEIQPNAKIPSTFTETVIYLPLLKQNILMLMEANAFLEASQLCSTALKTHANDLELWEMKCRSEMKSERLAQAEKSCTQFLKLDKNNSVAYFLSGQVAYKQSNYQSALTNYDLAVKLDPLFAPAWINLGITQIAIGNKTEGCKAISKGITLGEKASDQLLNYCGF